MTDREVLEAAAKAAGMTGMKWTGSSLGKMIDPTRPDETGTVGPNWNPLTDDGDALRLAVKLGLSIERDFDRIDVYRERNLFATEFLYERPTPTDIYAATRRAIVRAAAMA